MIMEKITVWKTEDGEEFTDQFEAVVHDNLLQFDKFGEFGQDRHIESYEKEV